MNGFAHGRPNDSASEDSILLEDTFRCELNRNLKCRYASRFEAPLPKSAKGRFIENLLPGAFLHPRRRNKTSRRINFFLT